MRYLFLSLMVIFILPSIANAGFKEEFEKEFLTKPWAGERIEENVCIGCHASERMRPAFRNIVDEWKMSWHAQNNISCQDCHGGDPKDAALAMSRKRGFVGTPGYREVPEFCGKCHIGILKNYREGGHGKALKSTGRGPHCVVCHGSHNIQKANIDTINEQRCTKCHSYERAKIMKQALFLVEKKLGEIEMNLKTLKSAGIYAGDEEKALFSTQAEYRTLFHTVDVSLVQERTDEFTNKLNLIAKDVQTAISEVRFRKNYSAYLMLLFTGMSIALLLFSRTPKD